MADSSHFIPLSLQLPFSLPLFLSFCHSLPLSVYFSYTPTHSHLQTNTHTHTHIKKHTQKETHKNVTHAPSFCRTAGAEDAVPRASRNTRATHRLLGPSAGEKDEREKEEMQREFLARDDRLLGPRADESTASKENQVMSLFSPHLRVDNCLCYCMAASSM